MDKVQELRAQLDALARENEQLRQQAGNARREALEEAAHECEDLAKYYSPEFMSKPFPPGYVYTPVESRAAMAFAFRQLNLVGGKIRTLITTASTVCTSQETTEVPHK